ncbi:RHS repeat protein [Aspergillus indologenus CBS 114.80]|uniref:RHS repeat protein n=1 Tax=Aspergillus indologenus CBS 114.80 TaxID=1450541 RepID=A0A2V5HXL9_9EURO|nr:RHS repeat protein [Aspergillus indologenus CBS 114.80]
MSLSQNAFYSQAFNFDSFLEKGVDPRTGQYTCTINVYSTPSEARNCPPFKLSLSYSSLSAEDVGLGQGWSFDLSSYRRHQGGGSIRLSTGEVYSTTETTSMFFVNDQKLKSFGAEKIGDHEYQLVLKSGQVEILSNFFDSYDRAVPTKLYDHAGRCLTFVWEGHGDQPRLAKVQDGSEDLIHIIYEDSQVKIIRAPETPGASTFTLIKTNDRLDELHTPLEDNTPPWTFGYEDFGLQAYDQFACLNRITTPAGLIEEVNFEKEGHKMPKMAPFETIPYVVSHVVRPGQQQPPIRTSYEYSPHNFVGFDGGYDWNGEEDNLYRVPDEYSYSTTVVVEGGSTTEYYYNKFHLPTKILQQKGTKQYVQDYTYHALPFTGFEDQPAQYQLPKIVRATYIDTETKDCRCEETTYDFDEWGNPTEEVQATGVKINRVYYSAAGEKDEKGTTLCPPDPHGFQRYMKTEALSPAESKYTTPTYMESFTYRELPTATDALASHYVVVATLVGSDEHGDQSRTEHEYVNKPSTRDHGRIEKQTTWISEKHPMVQDWAYEYPGNQQLKVTRTTTSFDGFATKKEIKYSLLSGQVLTHTDQAGVQDRFEYDKLDRVVEATTAFGTPNEAVRRHEYRPLEDKNGARLTVTDSKGVQTQYITDGLERIYQVKKQDDDVSWESTKAYAGIFRVVQERNYNAVGQCIEIVETDWLREKNAPPKGQPTVQKMSYDDWGEVTEVVDTNGVATLSLVDPIGLTRTSGIEGEGLTKTYLNVFGSPDKIEMLSKGGEVESSVEFLYDGLGRLIEYKNALGRTTEYKLDSFDRITKTLWPNNRLIEAEYAEHTASMLPVSIKTSGCVIAEQSFDGLDRVTQRMIGTRTTTQKYQGSSPEPHQIQRGHQLDLTYEPDLGYALLSRTADGETDSYGYDKRTGAPVLLENSHCTLNLEYYPSGLLKEEKIQATNSPELSARPIYSMAGKLQGYTDVHGQEYEAKYDAAGRVEHLLQGTMEVQFLYDKVSRVSEIQVEDEGHSIGLTTHVSYDDFGRETERKVLRGTKLLSKLKQVYGEASLVATRDLEDGEGNVLRHEGFEYDVYDRLVNYTCEGSRSPVDERGHAIRSQHFEFDAFNNVTEVTTGFEDGSTNTANYSFDDRDPTQLIKITNSHAAATAEMNLEYNDDGCLTRDEEGRTLEYDGMSRLVAVRDASGEPLSEYLYDATGRLICQKVPGEHDYLFFYREDQLIAVKAGDRRVSYLSDGEGYWGQIVQEGSTTQTQVWSPDSHQSVVTWIDSTQPDVIQSQQYTPYGVGSSAAAPSVGFNGQWRDPVTGWYHLGHGYRVYNPVLMRFHTPDPWSPFTSGEINPYAYCLGDPINRLDPSGHFTLFGMEFGWKDLITAVASIAGSIALGVLTGGASLAVQVGVAVAVGVAVEVTAGALGDLAEGNQITWASLGGDALSGALGGLTGKFGQQAAKQGLKTAVFGAKKALGRAGSAAITKAARQGGEKITGKAVKKLAVKAVKSEAKSFAKSKAKEGAKNLLSSGEDSSQQHSPALGGGSSSMESRDPIRPVFKDGEYILGGLAMQAPSLSSMASSYGAEASVGESTAGALNREFRFVFGLTGSSSRDRTSQANNGLSESFEQSVSMLASVRSGIRKPHWPTLDTLPGFGQ